MAYVFVHHLSAKYDSHLTEILQWHTDMPVSKVADKMKVQPNHVYVIPPNTFMRIQDGHLRLESTAKLDSSYRSVDYFWTSQAKVYQHNAIGILLSGTASDGTLGLKEIKEQGGVTFSQDESASHQQMSSSAQDAGYVD